MDHEDWLQVLAGLILALALTDGLSSCRSFAPDIPPIPEVIK